MLRKSLAAGLLVLALAALGTLTACNDSKSGSSVAVVDIETVFKTGKAAAAGMAAIDEVKLKLQTRLGEMRNELLAAQGDKALEERLQKELYDFQAAQETFEREVSGIINQLFDNSVEAYRKAKNIDVILPKQLVISMDQKLDVTTGIIAEMDKAEVKLPEFKLSAVPVKVEGAVPVKVEGAAPASAQKPADSADAEASVQADKAVAGEKPAPESESGAAKQQDEERALEGSAGGQ